MSRRMNPGETIKKRSLRTGILFFSVLSLIPLAAPACDENPDFTRRKGKSPLKGRSRQAALQGVQSAFHEIFRLYKKRVVFISTEKDVRVNPWMEDMFPGRKKRKQTGLGSGFFISSDGYICTNHHVVSGMDRVKVRVNGKEVEAKIIGTDPLTDLALLKIESSAKFEPAYLGDSNKVRVGDWAVAIGNPFGLDRTFTVGVISASVRQGVDQIGNAHIQTDASINPGNSGGPLINLDGEVIGVNRMIYSRGGGSLGIGFAIPINDARKILEQLKKYGKVTRGFIGVRIGPLPEPIAAKYGKKGVYVAGVSPGGPAEKAGVKQGDVILRVNGKTIDTFNDLLRHVGAVRPGGIARLRIRRETKFLRLRIRVMERPR